MKNYKEKIKTITSYKISNKISIKQIKQNAEIEKFGYYLEGVFLGLVFKPKKLKSHIFQEFNFPNNLKLVSYENLFFPQDKNKYVIIFRDGVVIFWNFSKEEEENFLQYLYFYVDSRIEVLQNEYIFVEKYIQEQDQNFFSNQSIQDDIIFLKSTQFEEKICFSFAFNMDLEFDFIEEEIGKIIEQTNLQHKFEMEQMIKSFNQKNHLKNLALIYKLRAKSIFEIKGIFEVFSSEMRDELIPLYKKCKTYLNIDDSILKRKKINRKKIQMFLGNF